VLIETFKCVQVRYDVTLGLRRLGADVSLCYQKVSDFQDFCESQLVDFASEVDRQKDLTTGEERRRLYLFAVFTRYISRKYAYSFQ